MIERPITEVPAGMLPHVDDSARHGYPPGVHHATVVTVIIACQGHLSQHTSQAQSFGWQIAPHAPVYCREASAAPITHYRIEQGSTP